MTRRHMCEAFLRWLALLVVVISVVPVHAQDARPTGQPEPDTPVAWRPAAVGQNSFSLLGARPGDPFPLSYIEVAYSPDLNNFAAGFSIEAWVKRNDASRNESVLCNDWDRSYCLMFFGGHVRLLSNGFGSRMDSLGVVPAGVWTHIAATFNVASGQRVLYINGVVDSTSYAIPGGIGTASGTPLGIGADLAHDYNQNYFSGLLDNVRLWKTALSGAAIRANMFQELTASAPNYSLVAEWWLNGDGTDAINHFHGTVHGGFFASDGAIPHDIRIPQRTVAPSVDGYCTSGEYQGDTQVIVSNGSPEGTPRTTAHLLRTATDLWICFEGLTPPTWFGDNWAAVYLDPDLSRSPVSQTNDYTLELRGDGSKVARAGDGSGGYTPTSAINAQWDGQYRIIDTGFSPDSQRRVPHQPQPPQQQGGRLRPAAGAELDRRGRR